MGTEAPAPLVIVEGFLCAASSLIWGSFDEALNQGAAAQQQRQQSKDPLSNRTNSTLKESQQDGRRIVFAPIGPVSSIHDRACELFYGLRGGTVDYGSEHAKEHGHGRYGKTFGKPLLPGWGNDLVGNATSTATSSAFIQENSSKRMEPRGAHFMGHSLGGLTIVKLYELLQEGFFDEALGISPQNGQGAAVPSPACSLMLSLTTVSSPHRGTPLVYSLGSIPGTEPQVRFLSPGDCLAKVVHLVSWARRLPILGLDAWLPDFFADAWAFTTSQSSAAVDEGRNAKEKWTYQELMGVRKLLSQLWKSDWAEGKDCAPWDCTFEERIRCEQQAEKGKREGTVSIWGSQRSGGNPDFPQNKIWLRSYAANMTANDQKDAFKLLAGHLSPLAITARLLHRFDYDTCSHPFISSSSKSAESGRRRSLRCGVDSGYCSSADEEDNDQPVLFIDRAKRDWKANDGVVPFASQFHPSDCKRGLHCRHEAWVPVDVSASSDAAIGNEKESRSWVNFTLSIAAAASLRLLGLVDSSSGKDRFLFPGSPQQRPRRLDPTPQKSDVPTSLPKPDIWHVCELQGTTHASLVPFWTGSEKQVAFWSDLGAWLYDVEMAHAVEMNQGTSLIR